MKSSPSCVRSGPEQQPLISALAAGRVPSCESQTGTRDELDGARRPHAAENIRDVPVRVSRSEEAKAVARKLVASASADAALHRFLGRLPKAA